MYLKINWGFYFLFLSVLFIGCKPIKETELYGNYIGPSGFEFSKKLQLLPNHKFKYSYQTGLISGFSDGMWYIKGRHIILESAQQPLGKRDKVYEIIESKETSDINQITIEVVDADKEPVSFANCAFKYNDSLVGGGISDMNGKLVYQINQKYNTIEISSWGSSLKFTVKNDKVNYYKIMIKWTAFYQYFAHTKFIIRSDGLKEKGSKKIPEFLNPKYFKKYPIDTVH